MKKKNPLIFSSQEHTHREKVVIWHRMGNSVFYLFNSMCGFSFYHSFRISSCVVFTVHVWRVYWPKGKKKKRNSYQNTLTFVSSPNFADSPWGYCKRTIWFLNQHQFGQLVWKWYRQYSATIAWLGISPCPIGNG